MRSESTFSRRVWRQPSGTTRPSFRGDVAAEVTNLKQQHGGDLLLLGHGLLGETLLQQRLIDVLDLGILPVMVGHGKPFFREGQAAKLKLAATKSFSNIVKLTYELQY